MATTIYTSVAEHPDFVAGWGGDGYDAMDAADASGWHVISGWGEQGWDAGSWPHVWYAIRRKATIAADTGTELIEWLTVKYCEGDLAIVSHPSKAAAYDWLDAAINNVPAHLAPPEQRRPFISHRSCRPGEPRCTECSDTTAALARLNVRVRAIGYTGAQDGRYHLWYQVHDDPDHSAEYEVAAGDSLAEAVRFYGLET